MERTKKATVVSRPIEPMVKLVEKEIKEIPVIVRPKLQYRKTGGGLLRILGKYVKPGDTFEAYPEQIPEGFKDLIKCISDKATQEQATKSLLKVYSKEFLYEVVADKSKGWFNVVNSVTQKTINEKTLKQEDAEKLCATLNT